jgi:hypothetical protein
VLPSKRARRARRTAGRSTATDDMSATSRPRSPLRRRRGRTTVGTPDPNEVSWTGKQIATFAQCTRCDSGATWPNDHSQYGLLRSRSTDRTAKGSTPFRLQVRDRRWRPVGADQMVVGIVNGFASRKVFGIIESDRRARSFCLSMISAFRVCCEGKPLSTLGSSPRACFSGSCASCETSSHRRSCRSPCARRAWQGRPD